MDASEQDSPQNPFKTWTNTSTNEPRRTAANAELGGARVHQPVLEAQASKHFFPQISCAPFWCPPLSATDSPMLTVWLHRLDQVRAKCRFKGLRFRARFILEAFLPRAPASNLGAACGRVESSFGRRRWNSPRAKASRARSRSIDIHRTAPAERRARLLNKLA